PALLSFVLVCAFSTALRRVFYFSFLLHPAPTVIYTLSLHDALPICSGAACVVRRASCVALGSAISYSRLGVALSITDRAPSRQSDRKSTRLNSSHQIISYAVFCLKKKNIKQSQTLLADDNEHA